MKTLKEELKKEKFHKIYLFCGTESYLKNVYRKRLQEKLLGSVDDIMNCQYYEGKNVKANDIIEIANTLPFMNDHRLLIIENSGFLKSGKKNESDQLSDYVDNIPNTTCIILIEEEIDKRNKLYKKISKVGRVVEFNQLNESDLIMWLEQTLKQNKKNMARATISYFIQTVGTDMLLLENELEKLISYNLDKDNITMEDINSVSTVLLENKIFEMMDSISEKKQEKALMLYKDLITLREPPLRILFMLVRQFRILLQIKVAMKNNSNAYTIANEIGLRKFIVDKSMSQLRFFNENDLKSALNDCLNTETLIKTGKMDEMIGVENLIIKYSMGN